MQNISSGAPNAARRASTNPVGESNKSGPDGGAAATPRVIPSDGETSLTSTPSLDPKENLHARNGFNPNLSSAYRAIDIDPMAQSKFAKNFTTLPMAESSSRTRKQAPSFFARVRGAVSRFFTGIIDGIARHIRGSRQAQEQSQPLKALLVPTSSKSKLREDPSIEETLESPDGSKAFLAFLDTEFSTENFHFVAACKACDQLTGQTYMTEATGLMAQFIGEKAATQVNLPHDQCVAINTAFGKAQNERTDENIRSLKNALGVARTGIVDLMRNDSYRRFVASNIGGTF
jgi:hypothetical protein